MRKLESKGEVNGLVDEGIFFFLALRVASRVSYSCLLQFLVWAVRIGIGKGEETYESSSSRMET